MYRVITTYPGRPEDRFLALQNTLKGIGYPSSLERLEGYARAIQGMVGYCSGLGSGVQGILRGPLSAPGTLHGRCCYALPALLLRSLSAPATLHGCSWYAPWRLLVRSLGAAATLPTLSWYAPHALLVQAHEKIHLIIQAHEKIHLIIRPNLALTVLRKIRGKLKGRKS